MHPNYLEYEVTISAENIILQREKEHCAIFIHPHLIWGLPVYSLGLGQAEVFEFGLGLRLGNLVIA